MYCSKCGNEIENDEKFCSKCGQGVIEQGVAANNSSEFIRNKFYQFKGVISSSEDISKLKNKINIKVVIAVLALVIIIIVALISTSNPKNKIIGDWSYNSNGTTLSYTFKKDNTFILASMGGGITGKYEIKDKTLYIYAEWQATLLDIASGDSSNMKSIKGTNETYSMNFEDKNDLYLVNSKGAKTHLNRGK